MNLSSSLRSGLLEVLRRVPGVELAVVFGSVAEGRAQAHSDLDIAVSAGDRALTAVEKTVLIAQELESLRRCVARIGSKCPSDPQVLMRDPDVQDIVSLNLSRAVQLYVDIGAHWIVGLDVSPPQTMGETFDRLSQAGVLDGELATRLKKAWAFATWRCMTTARSTG